MATLALDTGTLYYEDHGCGDAVILAHGAGGNGSVWWQQVPVLREHFRCITFDHRGFGRSRVTPDPEMGSSFVADLAALIDHLGLDRVSLVGQSMGGWTTLGYARRYPGRVRRLVLASSRAGLTSPDVEGALARAAGLPIDPVEAPRAYGNRLRQERPDLAVLYDQLASFNTPIGPETTVRLTGDIHAATAAEVADFRVPTLFISGVEDILHDSTLAAAKLIPGARVSEIPAAGHSTYFQRPAQFNQLVIDFLQEI